MTRRGPLHEEAVETMYRRTWRAWTMTYALQTTYATTHNRIVDHSDAIVVVMARW